MRGSDQRQPALAATPSQRHRGNCSFNTALHHEALAESSRIVRMWLNIVDVSHYCSENAANRIRISRNSAYKPRSGAEQTHRVALCPALRQFNLAPHRPTGYQLPVFGVLFGAVPAAGVGAVDGAVVDPVLEFGGADIELPVAAAGSVLPLPAFAPLLTPPVLLPPAAPLALVLPGALSEPDALLGMFSDAGFFILDACFLT